jgi:hypothetical protein
MRTAVLWFGGACLVASLSACSGASQPASSPDPFSNVAQQSDEAYRQGLERYQQGQFREALDAFNKARLLSPTDDPRIDEMIQRAATQLTPTPTEVPPTATPRPEPSPGATAVASPTVQVEPTGTPMPLPTSAPVAAPPAPAPPPAQPRQPAPTLAAVATAPPPVPTPLPAPVAAPVAAPVPTPVPTATTLRVPGGASALAVAEGADQVFLADKSGLVWRFENGRPVLYRPFAVTAEPVGLAADSPNSRLYLTVRGDPAVLALDLATGRQVAAAHLPGEPGEARLDSALGLLYVVVADELETLSVSDLSVVRSTAGLTGITGIALDPQTHLLYVSHLSGELSVLDGQTGAVVARPTVSGVGLTGVAAGHGRLYAINTPGRQLLAVDPTSYEVTEVGLPAEPVALAIGPRSGAAYVLEPAANAVLRVNPDDAAEPGVVPLGDGWAQDSSLPADQLWQRSRVALDADSERVYAIGPDATKLAITPPEL